MKIVTGSLFDAPEQYICHQCNCVTSRAKHLAYDMFQRFPYANIYAPRYARSGRELPEGEKPGDIIVRGNGLDQRFVVALLGQYYPGKPRFPDSKRDGSAARERYFAACLEKLVAIEGMRSVAFPWGIGCGAAGGDWGKYQAMIERAFAGKKIGLAVYKLP